MAGINAPAHGRWCMSDGKILIGTILLDLNRWGNPKTPWYEVSEWIERFQQAGFDGVEIHAAHGYLLSTFLSPAWNRRDDVYGGSLEGRTRLLTDVVVAVRQRCGPEFVIVVRLDGHEYGVEGGITVQDATEHARAAVAASANAVHVSAISSAGLSLIHICRCRRAI